MTLDNFIDSKPVQAILEKRGYIIKKTPKVKEIIDFNRNWEFLFKIFYEKPFLRIIFYYFVHELKNGNPFLEVNPIVSEFILYEKNIENAIEDFPMTIEICPYCENDNFIKKERYGKHLYYCKSCKKEFDNPKSKNSFLYLKSSDMYNFLKDLVEAKILVKGFQLACYDCNQIKYYPDEEDAKKNILCLKCKSLQNITKTFTLIETLGKITDLDSIWLEWYVLKLISEKCKNIISIVPNHEVTDGNFRTEVDLLVLTKNDNLISIDCKAKIFRSTLSKDDINNNILHWAKFSDSVLIATTTEISENCEKLWHSQSDKIVFVDGKNLEKLDVSISKM